MAETTVSQSEQREHLEHTGSRLERWNVLRSLVRQGVRDAIWDLFGETDRVFEGARPQLAEKAYQEVLQDLNVWLSKALHENDHDSLNAIVQAAAFLGDQDFLLTAQAACIPPRKIVLEDDSALIASIATSFDMTAKTPMHIGPESLLEGWAEADLLPTLEDEQVGPSRRTFGKDARSVMSEYNEWSGPRRDAAPDNDEQK